MVCRPSTETVVFLRTTLRSCDRLDPRLFRWSSLVLYYVVTQCDTCIFYRPDKRGCVDNNKVIHRECPVDMCSLINRVQVILVIPDFSMFSNYVRVRFFNFHLFEYCYRRDVRRLSRDHRRRNLCYHVVKTLGGTEFRPWNSTLFSEKV